MVVFSEVEFDGQIDFYKAAEAVRAKKEQVLRAYDHSVWDEIHLQTEIIFKREQWQSRV
jgi:hypothetical protein